MSGERWNYKRFRQWRDEMEKVGIRSRDKHITPTYDIEAIARDLCVTERHVRTYCSGLRNGEPVTVPAYIVRLCECLLARKRVGYALADARQKHPHLAEIIDPIIRMVTP